MPVRRRTAVFIYETISSSSVTLGDSLGLILFPDGEGVALADTLGDLARKELARIAAMRRASWKRKMKEDADEHLEARMRLSQRD